MNIISKVGQRDNVVTYEHICDTSADMSKIDRKYITLGSTCIVLAGESGAMEVYMADSEKEWHDILAGASSGSNTPSGLSIHICTQNEVSNGMPDIEFPLETELYLVPAREDSGNLYDEYIWVDGEWELFGGASANLDGVVMQEDLNEALATKLTYGGSVESENMLVDDGIVSADVTMEKPGAIKLVNNGVYVDIMLQDNDNNFIPIETYEDESIPYFLFTDLDNGTYTLKSQYDDVYFYLWDENGNQIAENVQECQLIVNNDSRVYVISRTDLSLPEQEVP